jgi:hypothetical protein
MCQEAFVGIFQPRFPVPAHPTELTVHPYAQSELMAVCVVLLAHAGKIDVPQAVVTVKGDKEAVIAYGNVAGHRTSLLTEY